MKKKWFYLIFFTLLVLAFWYFLFQGTGIMSKSTLTVRSRVQNFTFTNQLGNSFSKEDMQGKVCVVNYFFTTCKGICPKMNHNMQRIYETFKNQSGFLILSHTCQPEVDSVPRLKHYADSMNAMPDKWVFLTGRKDSLYSIARFSYGIDDPKNAVNNIQDDFLHSQFFALVDKNGNVRGAVYDGLKEAEIVKLIEDTKALLKEKPLVNGFQNSLY